MCLLPEYLLLLSRVYLRDDPLCKMKWQPRHNSYGEYLHDKRPCDIACVKVFAEESNTQNVYNEGKHR